jgi:hypothetical protein
VQFCSDEASLLDGFARFAAVALEAGSTAVAVTTSSHREGLEQRLQASGLDICLAIEERRFIWLDVADVLGGIVVNGEIDEARFWESATALAAAAGKAATRTPARVVAFGECAPTLWIGGHPAAAIRLEQLWDEFAKAYDMEVFCGYCVTTPLDDKDEQVFKQICVAHTAVHRQ